MALSNAGQKQYIKDMTTWSPGTFDNGVYMDGLWSYSGKLGVATTVYYSTNAALSWYSGGDMVQNKPALQLTPVQITRAQDAMKAWENVCNITFKKADATHAPQLVFSQIDFTDGTQGLTVPNKYVNNNQITQVDVFVNYGYPDTAYYTPGSYIYKVMMHEIGHSMGLSHPGPSGQGTDPNYNHSLSLMSYNTYLWNDFISFNPSTPMLYDIAAAQFLYGANYTYNGTNTNYVLGVDRFWCVWDGGGTDTFDLRQYTGTDTTTIDLRGGVTFNAATGETTANMSHLGGLDWFTIAFDPKNASQVVDIERVLGSAVADSVIGGYVANTLYGYGGNDTLMGGGGNDLIYGGVGNDTLYSFFPTKALNVYAAKAGNTTLNGDAGNDLLYGGDGKDTLNGGADNDVIYWSKGGDVVDGGTGVDTFSFKKATPGANINQNVAVYPDSITVTNVENLQGSANNDRIGWEAAMKSIDGAAGVDTFDVSKMLVAAHINTNKATYPDTIVTKNVESIIGSAYSDVIGWEAAMKTINGGAGTDTFDFSKATQDVIINFNDPAYPNPVTVTGVEVYKGSVYNDLIIGTAGKEYFYDGAGNDGIGGEAGNDTFYTTADYDVDYPDDGYDVFAGGAGADTYFFISKSAHAEVLDLTTEDKVMVNNVNLTTIQFSALATPNQYVSADGKYAIDIAQADDVLTLVSTVDPYSLWLTLDGAVTSGYTALLDLA